MKDITKINTICLFILLISLSVKAQFPGTPYVLPAINCKGLGIIAANATCSGATISVTGCSCIQGAIINDDVSSTQGIEYDWTGASSYIASNTTTRALVEIGGQCWYRINADAIPTNYSSPPAFSSTNNGAHGYYSGGPYSNEGRLYQWTAAMNGATAERAQGMCAPGFHIPSDCEWMFLENTLGMTATCQQLTGVRCSGIGNGDVSCDIRISGSCATNISGFSMLLVGYYDIVSGFGYRGSDEQFWTSTQTSTTSAWYRDVWGSAGVGSTFERTSGDRAYGFNVRCISD